MITISLRSVKWLSVCVLALGLAGGLLSPATAYGAEPTLPAGLQETTTGTAPDLSVFSAIKFSGALKDSSGEPLTGTVGLTFAFYPEQSGGAPLWLETQNVTLDSQGNYTALIGATKAEGLPLTLFSSGEARWLGIQVGTEAEQPRILLVSVPYALKAAEAETLGGMTADEFVSGTQLETKVQQEVETQLTLQNESVFTMTNDNTPTFRPSIFEGDNASQIVLVKQKGPGTALHAATAGRIALSGVARANDGRTTALRGVNLSTGGTAVVGQSIATTGATTGVLASVRSPGGTAIVAVNKGNGKLISGWANGAEQFSVQGDGTVTATAFVGDGSGLTGIGGTETSGDADTLDGLDSTDFARLNGGNTFTGNQTINGDFTVSTTTGGYGFRVIGRNIIGGHSSNSLFNVSLGATISGGGATGNPNRVIDDFGTVGGGMNNTAGKGDSENLFATVGGGNTNRASGYASTIAGGALNKASNLWSAVAGGSSNAASGQNSFVGGGGGNIAKGFVATIGGGSNNTASGQNSFVGGGAANTASGFVSTVPGGISNIALGNFSFAAGRNAKANHAGAFVWADSKKSDFASTADNQFTVRATGGFRFITAIDSDTGAPTATVEISPGTGTVTAPAFVGDGSGLTNLPPSSAPSNTVTIPAGRAPFVVKVGETETSPLGAWLQFPQGVTLRRMRVCGVDNDSETGTLRIRLFAQPISGVNALEGPVVLGEASSGVAFADATAQCFETELNVTIDNTQNYYYFKWFEVVGPVSIIAAQFEY